MIKSLLIAINSIQFGSNLKMINPQEYLVTSLVYLYNPLIKVKSARKEMIIRVASGKMMV